MRTLLYAATTNPGKLRDFSVAAEESGIGIEPLPGLREIPAPDENQPTFEGNARLKAEYYSRFTPDLVLADDSGLEVDALHGQPGVRSARFAEDVLWHPSSRHASWPPLDIADGPPNIAGSPLNTDQRNNLCILERMRGITQRAAHYHCVLAVARGATILAIAHGRVEGEILAAPRGTGGFGYDPLFWLPDLQRTMAEISLEQKHTLSHRGRAFRALLPQLNRLCDGAGAGKTT